MVIIICTNIAQPTAGRNTYINKVIEAREVALFVVAKLPGITMCENVIVNW